MRSGMLAAAALVGLAAGCEPGAPTALPDRPGPQFINQGVPTGDAYPNVGAILFDFDEDGKIVGNEELCTGSLIEGSRDPNVAVFLTAAHCLEFLPEGAQLFVSFDPELPLEETPNLIAAIEFHFDPLFGHDQFDLHDLGVILLPADAEQLTGIPPLHLPTAGLLDERAKKGGLRGQLFVNVGYGVSANRTGIPDFEFDGKRKVSKSPFVALQPHWLGLLMNSFATGEGGDCFGDSGSPKFFDGDTTMIVATVTWGDAVCRATSWDYRLDTPSARAFLEQFVRLP